MLQHLGGEDGLDAAGAHRQVGPVAEDLHQRLHPGQHLPHLGLLVEDRGWVLEPHILIHVRRKDVAVGALRDAHVEERPRGVGDQGLHRAAEVAPVKPVRVQRSPLPPGVEALPDVPSVVHDADPLAAR